jgi:hypothetical protein
MTKLQSEHLLWLVVLAGLFATSSNALPNGPIRIDADIPFEMLAPWWNPEHTEVEDEVLLRGTLHVTQRTWVSGTRHVDRLAIQGNAVDIHGTSDATGQRFRLNGSYTIDLRDPEGTLSPEGIFTLAPQTVYLRLHKVDPEPARLDAYLGMVNSSAAATYISNTNPAPCVRTYLPDGTPTGWFDCGDIQYGTYIPPELYNLRVRASGGAACATGCDVPDGAILSNGFNGDYNPPLLMTVNTWPASNTAVRFHCRTGSLEAPASSVTTPTGWYGFCSPFYSATEPIRVYADITIRPSGYTVSSQIRTYSMLERPIGGIPHISSSYDKIAFLAATGSDNSTGPLPNLGAIADSATIGSVTFSMAPGAAGLYIGGGNSVPDWYPQTPGNEIALGYERLRVITSAPVFALGFDFIEPNTTMPLWGGTPVDSTYEVTLFSGATWVGRFTFNAPDDVAPAFIGVWSDTAFDQAVIIDITPSSNADDDEYFGEFFTGATPLH